MATPRGKRLKVFETQLGFFDTVVAAPSHAAALEAWGVRQNLFAEGRARVTTDAASAKAALEHPGAPLRRAVGSHDPFEPEPQGLPSPPAEARQPQTPRAPKPDRSAMDRAEARLAKLAERQERAEAGFEARQNALDQARRTARADFDRARREAAAAVEEAARAYRKAGGA